MYPSDRLDVQSDNNNNLGKSFPSGSNSLESNGEYAVYTKDSLADLFSDSSEGGIASSCSWQAGE
jgi:hypothetical protein